MLSQSGLTALTQAKLQTKILTALHPETFEKCSILVKVKTGENFNHRNPAAAGLNISRIEI